jgi:hypothetical protein
LQSENGKPETTGNTLPPDRFDAVFRSGIAARQRDKDLSDNPHPEKSVERRVWYNGWCQANLQQHIYLHGKEMARG